MERLILSSFWKNKAKQIHLFSGLYKPSCSLSVQGACCPEDIPGCSAPAACLSQTDLEPLWPLKAEVERKGSCGAFTCHAPLYSHPSLQHLPGLAPSSHPLLSRSDILAFPVTLCPSLSTAKCDLKPADLLPVRPALPLSIASPPSSCLARRRNKDDTETPRSRDDQRKLR